MSDLLKEYQELIGKTAIYPVKEGINYCALGLGSEVGEIQSKLKKIIRDKDGVMTVDDTHALMDECSDVLWYITALAKELGYTLDQIMEHNIQKLTSRLERGVLKGSGDNR